MRSFRKITDYRFSENEAFPLMKCIRNICRMGPWSFCSWFDVNRSTFDEDMREKRFLDFRSQWPWPLTFTPQICSLVTHVQGHVSAKLEVPTLTCFEKIRDTGRTERQTDRRTGCNAWCSHIGRAA